MLRSSGEGLVFVLPSIDSVIKSIECEEGYYYSVNSFSKNWQATLKVFDKILDSGLSLDKSSNYLDSLHNHINSFNFSLAEKIIDENLDSEYLEYLDSVNSFNFSLTEKIILNDLGHKYLEYLEYVNKNNFSLAEKIILNDLGHKYLEYLEYVNKNNFSLAEKIVDNNLDHSYLEYLDSVNKNNFSLAEKIIDNKLNPLYLYSLNNVDSFNFFLAEKIIDNNLDHSYLEYLDNVNKNNFSLAKKIIDNKLNPWYLRSLNNVNRNNFSLAEKIINNKLDLEYLDYLDNVDSFNFSLAEKIIDENLDSEYLEYLDSVNKNNFSLAEKIISNDLGYWYLEDLSKVNRNNFSLADIIIIKNLNSKYLEHLGKVNRNNFSLAKKIVNNNLGHKYLKYLEYVNKNNFSLAEKIIDENLDSEYLEYLNNVNKNNFSLAKKIIDNNLDPWYLRSLNRVNSFNFSLVRKIIDNNLGYSYLDYLAYVNENNFSFVNKVINLFVPPRFLECLRKINNNNLSDYKDLLQFAIERGARKVFYENAYRFDNVDLLKKLVEKEVSEDFYNLASSFINVYGERFIDYALKHKDFDKLPLLPQAYADKVKSHLSRKNASKLINLVNLLRKQGVSPDEISIPSNNKINYLKDLVCEYYEKEGRKIRIDNPHRALRYFYSVENEKLKSVLEEILADTYNPRSVYSFSKEYFLEHDEGGVRSEIEDLESLLGSVVESVKVIIPDYSFEISSESIACLKEQAKRIKKDFNNVFREKGFKKEALGFGESQVFEEVKSNLSRIINYSPKIKQGRITIKLDSKDKVGQARLLEEISSCLHLTEGDDREHSQEYLTTDEINFVGVYNERSLPLARFTLGVDPINKRVGVLSKIYKKCDNNLVSYVRDWVNSFAEENSFEVGGMIELPVSKFYDDAGDTKKGRVKSLDLNKLNEIGQY